MWDNVVTVLPPVAADGTCVDVMADDDDDGFIDVFVNGGSDIVIRTKGPKLVTLGIQQASVESRIPSPVV